MPGKMLRTRWAARLAESGELHVAPDTIMRACAAIELAHTASLCHDDVIDGGFLRRQHPTLWRVMGSTAAILVGDLLLCEAMDVLVSVENGGLVEPFTVKLREVCAAELEQDLGSRGKVLEEAACLRLARGKSGPFFAFLGYACGGAQPDLRAALEAAGYQVGTLYQMADDLLDVVGGAGRRKDAGDRRETAEVHRAADGAERPGQGPRAHPGAARRHSGRRAGVAAGARRPPAVLPAGPSTGLRPVRPAPGRVHEGRRMKPPAAAPCSSARIACTAMPRCGILRARPAAPSAPGRGRRMRSGRDSFQCKERDR